MIVALFLHASGDDDSGYVGFIEYVKTEFKKARCGDQSLPLIRIFLCGDQSLPLDLNETGILPGPEKSGEAPTKIFDRTMMRVIRTDNSFLHLNEERHG